MKHLAAMEVIEETGADKYKLNSLSLVLSTERYGDAFPYMRKGSIPGILRLPEYLATRNYSNPTDPVDGPFQFANNTSQHWFAWAPKQKSNVFENFSNHMGAYNNGRPNWTDKDFYPVQERLFDGLSASKDEVVLVDVGGSLGHDVESVLTKFPDVTGRFVLQDLPKAIEQARSHLLNERIEPMVHDFFTEQPIKNARAYYMHSVLHDWPDSKCLEILRYLTAAMKPGYSKLLIHENVIPDTGAHWQSTALDLIMMSMVSSKERKETEWRQVIQAAGLQIAKIWKPSSGAESLIECELA